MKIITKIEFEFDTDNMEDELLREFSSVPEERLEELKQYAIDCMVDDIHNMVKYNEVSNAIRVETIRE